VIAPSECMLKCKHPLGNLMGRIHIKRRPEFPRKGFERHPVAVQCVPRLRVMKRTRRWIRFQEGHPKLKYPLEPTAPRRNHPAGHSDLQTQCRSPMMEFVHFKQLCRNRRDTNEDLFKDKSSPHRQSLPGPHAGILHRARASHHASLEPGFTTALCFAGHSLRAKARPDSAP